MNDPITAAEREIMLEVFLWWEIKFKKVAHCKFTCGDSSIHWEVAKAKI